ncbi:hypothetical protein [Psychrobacter sp.]|uniref:hypothetical protein n=1 Tax=Psychrobacter sp. TaxID=56811 RepID=UPI003F9D6546
MPASKPINTQNDSTDIQSKKPTQPRRQKRIVIPDNLDIIPNPIIKALPNDEQRAT